MTDGDLDALLAMDLRRFAVERGITLDEARAIGDLLAASAMGDEAAVRAMCGTFEMVALLVRAGLWMPEPTASATP